MKTYCCLNCDSESPVTYQKLNKYCSLKCQQDFQYKKFIKNWLEVGNSKSSTHIKRFILARQFGKCNHCGISDWNNKPIVLELEHKDGDSSNNNQSNLECLCPNCHSQTATYKNRNKGNGRHSRRVRYAEGKSF